MLALGILLGVCAINGLLIIPKLLVIYGTDAAKVAATTVVTATQSGTMPTKTSSADDVVSFNMPIMHSKYFFESVSKGELNDGALDLISELTAVSSEVSGKAQNLFRVDQKQIQALLTAIEGVTRFANTGEVEKSASNVGRGEKYAVSANASNDKVEAWSADDSQA